MATAKIIFDNRQKKKNIFNPVYPIIIRITHNRESRSLQTGYSCTWNQWNEDESEIKKSAEFGDYKKANREILDLKAKALKYFGDNRQRLPFLSCEQLRDEIKKYDPDKKEDEPKNKNLTIGEAVRIYKLFLRNDGVPEHKQHNRAKNWLKDLDGMLNVLLKCIGENTSIQSVDASHAGKYYAFIVAKKKNNSKKISSYRFNSYVDCATRLFNFLIKEEYPCKNPFKDIERKSSKTKPKMALLEEFYQVLDKIDNGNHIQIIKYKTKENLDRVEQKNMRKYWLKPAIQLALLGGGRRAKEIAFAKWTDIIVYKETNKLPGGTISYTDYKVNDIQKRELDDEKLPIQVPITPQFADFLISIGWEEKKGTDNYIIAPETSNRTYIVNCMCKGFKHYYQQIENPREKISFKSLRKLYITYLTDILAGRAKDVTGHADEKTIGKHYEDATLINKRVVENLVFKDPKTLK